jgi:hypothetical protein
VNFSAPIQAITTTSAYRTHCRPMVANGCSAVPAAATAGWVILSMTDSFRARDIGRPGRCGVSAPAGLRVIVSGRALLVRRC